MFQDSVDPAMLRHHGDVDARPGMLDFAVNVRGTAPPAWLRDRLAARLDDLGRYPSAADEAAARAAVAARHSRRPDEVLLLAGAAEGFALLPRLTPRLAAVIHPSFTEPELALREAGIPVTRVVLEPPYTLDPALVPEEADLVVLGNPTNPTSVLHPAAMIHALRRPGRIVVVDEAFADAVVGAGSSADSDSDHPALGAAVAHGSGIASLAESRPLAPAVPDSFVGSGSQSGQGSLAGPGPRTGRDALAGSGPQAGQGAVAGLGLQVGRDALAGSGSQAGQDAVAGLGLQAGQDALAGAGSSGAPDTLAGRGVQGDPESLAALSAPDVLVLRSLTKTWALAGLRCGYALGAPEVLARLTHGRPHWPLGTLQLEAISATAEPSAVAAAREHAGDIAVERSAMIERLSALGIEVHTPAAGPFLLLRVTDGELVRKRLADRGIAVRRADTFPGLGPDHLRVAVRAPGEVDRLIDGLRAALW